MQAAQGRQSHRIIGGHKTDWGSGGSPPAGYREGTLVEGLLDKVPQKLKLHIIFALIYNQQQLLLLLDKINLKYWGDMSPMSHRDRRP